MWICGGATDWLTCMQFALSWDTVLASERHCHALACAGRHTGPSTTSISLSAEAVGHCLLDALGQPGALMEPSLLANVVCLDLVLHDDERETGGDDIRQFAHGLLQRMPNLAAAKLWFCTMPEVPYMPLLHLKHLDLGLDNPNTLERTAFADYFPALETAHISAFNPGTIAELDFSGCLQLTRLVLDDVVVCHLSKPPQCSLRLDWLGYEAGEVDASELQSIVFEVHEIEVYSNALYPDSSLFTSVCWPELEVIRCDWSHDGAAHEESSDDEETGQFSYELECLSHNSNLPALKSIICFDYQDYDQTVRPPVMEACLPTDLAGVEELIIATDRPLQLAYHGASSAWERLNTFCAIGRIVRVGAAALFDMADALSRRGLTLSTAYAGSEHEEAPSQCLYVRAFSAPQLSYDEAVRVVSGRVGTWGRKQRTCGQCGACFDCFPTGVRKRN